MPLQVITSDRFGLHTPPPGHPERPERQDVMHVVAARWQGRGASLVEPTPASRAQILRVHSEALVEALEATAGRAAMLDADTFTSPESWELTQLSAGAAVNGVDAVLDGGASRAAALVRPPGHHSGREKARGFCLVNNVAVAAAHALDRGVPRVAIVDFDVHHGNGTQEIFETDPRVLYVSTHQWPHYPGSGMATEVGTGDGEGFTVNLPLDAGATDADYDVVFRDIVVPIVEEFAPGIVLVSAGFDAHERDPLAGMRMTEAGYALITRHIAGVADRCCAGRAVLVT
ncbi:MAG: histone deacetylase, partial [Acidobacteria bacterium]|nr:histone deacetylase [Acidobacteriota bacterium]